jgi:hypothetical protein
MMNMDNHRYAGVIVGTGSAACLRLGPIKHEAPIDPAGAIGPGAPIVERES